MTELTDLLIGMFGIVGNRLISAVSGQSLRDEVSAWVTLIGSIAITITTIGLQVYRMIRDRNKDKNKPVDDTTENEKSENDNN